MSHYPAPQGLYHPSYEHDACGVAFVADMHGRPTHDIVEKGIQALVNLEHRGAAGAEKNTGDGAGILIQVPDRFYREILAAQGIDLPAPGCYATGIAFLPAARMAALDAMRAVEAIIAEENLELLGWREVPVDDTSLGAMARDAEPIFYQLFLAGKDAEGNQLGGIELDRRAWFVRKRAERELGSKGPGEGPGGDTVYFPSLSARTIVYKGMLTTPQLREFYLDLQDDRVASALAVVHSRFSTNTFPSWPLAHPYRMVAHNGEINTVRGNENWMRARESQIRSETLGDIERVLPVCDPAGSDTGRFDEALEMLHLAGRSPSPLTDPGVIKQLKNLAWHVLPYADGYAFPGGALLRLSMDLATGTAGVLLAIGSVLHDEPVHLPLLAPTRRPAARQSQTPAPTGAGS
jgi:glutamate synthase (NADPH/NADH) large chain